MKEILEDVGSLDVATNKAKNAMVVFHLDGCSPCEGTLGSMEYERAQADSVLVKTGIHPFKSWSKPRTCRATIPATFIVRNTRIASRRALSI